MIVVSSDSEEFEYDTRGTQEDEEEEEVEEVSSSQSFGEGGVKFSQDLAQQDRAKLSGMLPALPVYLP